jgi:uncharacterized protein DUF4404
MSPDRGRLDQALRELRAELDDLSNIDPQLRQRLERTVADLEQALAETTPAGSTAARQSGLAQRLTEMARHFEETHPTLSGTLGSVIDALARMGI